MATTTTTTIATSTTTTTSTTNTIDTTTTVLLLFLLLKPILFSCYTVGFIKNCVTQNVGTIAIVRTPTSTKYLQVRSKVRTRTST